VKRKDADSDLDGKQMPDNAEETTKAATDEKSEKMSQYIFTFELLRSYPSIRSFIVKQPLKHSFNDTLAELFGGNKKSGYTNQRR
jgi:hypothetical protein